MSKYKILWIDDKWDEMTSFKEVCEHPKNGFEIVTCKYAVEGMKIFENFLEEWSGVILDAKVLMDETSQIDKLDGLTYSKDKILRLSHKREVPYYIFTGQPDTASGTSFAQEHKGHYYEKDVDDDHLIEDIKTNANNLLETQIKHKNQLVFDTWSDSAHDLLRILKVLESEDWQNNSVLNDIRKIMNDVMDKLYECGFCTVKHDGSNLAPCSKMLCQPFMEKIIPIYIQRAIHTCVAVTNPGSHRTETDSDVKDGRAPYLIRSLIYNMLDILYWCRCLPPKEFKQTAILAIEQAKIEYDIEQSQRKRMK